MARRMSAMVRRRRDGHVAFDLDVVHAGVVAEALEQTRAVLLGEEPPVTGGAAEAASGAEAVGGPDDEFDAIVAGLDMPTTGEDGTGRADVGADERPDDPVLRRLLPDASLDDEATAAEFRRLAGTGVRDAKVAAIDSVLADLVTLRRQEGGVVVDPGRAAAWLTALNDCRLALGTLLAVGEDDDLHGELDAYEAEIVAEAVAAGEGDDVVVDPAGSERALRAYRIAVYDFLSALLEMLVRALDR
ncbi:DUF2017 family protein [Aquipuribacter nitratireducens]|uniref:DUF2017 family protein n=1 Tax=Aquipuribacter nitratireducens TaxID=650104 RepID=A0ABW0GP07_9MICO